MNLADTFSDSEMKEWIEEPKISLECDKIQFYYLSLLALHPLRWLMVVILVSLQCQMVKIDDCPWRSSVRTMLQEVHIRM